jgi:hypothetical protein
MVQELCSHTGNKNDYDVLSSLKELWVYEEKINKLGRNNYVTKKKRSILAFGVQGKLMEGKHLETPRSFSDGEHKKQSLPGKKGNCVGGKGTRNHMVH